ncbi:MAG TPA: hypothetical protein VLW51_00700 [Solirubrobacteraceae bacterium]|nr:hypothetical protein [Solirubrobacteraceae bacterium]
MSVTNPTLKPEPLDDAAAVLVLDAAAALLVLLLLLLLPHAASPRASTATARAPRPDGLILPDTTVSFLKSEWATITRPADRMPVA